MISTYRPPDDDSQFAKLRFHIVPRQNMQSRQHDRSFDHRVLGTVEAEEIAEPMSEYNVGINNGSFPRGVDRLDSKLIGPAAIVENETADSLGVAGGRKLREFAEGRPGDHRGIIGDVEHPFPVGCEILVRLRTRKRPE